MAGVDDKIINNLFVWGTEEDLVELVPAGVFKSGSKPGALIYGNKLNTPLREGTLVSYSLIEALKIGPNVGPITENDLSGNWYDNLPTIDFDYREVINTTTLAEFYGNLNTVLNQYLKYSQVYRSVQANVWRTGRSFTIKDADDTNTGTVTQNVNGSADVVLHLPATIKADLTGTASNATEAAHAALATSATKLTTSSAGSSSNPVYFASGQPVACNFSFEHSKLSHILYDAISFHNGNTVRSKTFTLEEDLVIDSIKVMKTTDVSQKNIIIDFRIRDINYNTFDLKWGWFKINLSGLVSYMTVNKIYINYGNLNLTWTDLLNTRDGNNNAVAQNMFICETENSSNIFYVGLGIYPSTINGVYSINCHVEGTFTTN